MKINLLSGCDAIPAARVDQITGAAMDVIFADVFDKQERTLGEFTFEHKGCFGRELVVRVGRKQKIREHAADAPAISQIPRPGKLDVGLHAGTGECLRAGRQPGAKRPERPTVEEIPKAARVAFPGVKLGGGMLSTFTELNRKRPKAALFDLRNR